MPTTQFLKDQDTHLQALQRKLQALGAKHRTELRMTNAERDALPTTATFAYALGEVQAMVQSLQQDLALIAADPVAGDYLESQRYIPSLSEVQGLSPFEFCERNEERVEAMGEFRVVSVNDGV